MKSKYFKITLIGLLTIVSSCTDILDEVNKTGKTEDIVYSSDKSIESLVAVCYSYNRLWYGKEAGFNLTEGGTDLWYNGKDNPVVEMINYTGLTPNYANSCLDQYWEAFYAAINLCNIAEKNLQNNITLSNEKITQYLGEVRFLRAFYYWHMVELWGPVQLNLQPVSTPSTVSIRNSVDEIYIQMFKDVQFAIDNLSTSIQPSSRASKWAAKALKARLALYYASEYGKTDYYTIAATEANDVISGLKNTGRDLYSNYEDVWNITNSTTSNNNEFIWSIDYYDVIDPNIKYNNLPSRMNGQNWSGLIARRQTSESGGSGGNIMHLMVTPIWNSQSDATGGAAINADVLRRVCGSVNGFYLNTDINRSTATTYDVGYWYVKYAMGYCRYAPTKYCLDLFDETMDQRWNVTFRTAWYKHPDVVPRNYGSTTLTCNYPLMSIGTQTDTVMFYSKRKLTSAQKSWAAGRYKILSIANTFDSIADGTITEIPNTSSGQTGANSMYAMMRKFENTDSKITLPNTNFNDYFSYRDFPVFRISEMYLIAAESLMSTNQTEAVNLINILRTKRALPGKTDAMQISSVDIDFILAERAREFAGENIRWFDLKRTKKLHTQIVHNTRAYENFDQTKHYLRPIPASQINNVSNRDTTGTQAPGTFWQNPGY